jgi:glutathione reductase (NADPH)
MARRYDVVIVGTGTAASAIASRCRAAAWSVAVIDSRPFGGTCALRGCDPKKVLVGAGEAIEWIHRLSGKGIESGNARIDWPRLMEFKRSMIADVPKSREDGFKKQGIDAFHGRARFSGPRTVMVGDDALEGRYIAVAAGAKPATVTIPGAEHLVTSEQFLELDRLPSRVLFVGGGYISFEFAHIAARAGASVSILHRGTRPLPPFDPDLVDLLVAKTRALDIDVQLQTEVTRIHKRGEQYEVEASTARQTRTFAADMVVHGAGRVPEIDDLHLDAAGVAWDVHGVKVNEYLQSVSNPSVYAAGDAAASGGPPLTPVAGYDGRIVATNLLEGNHVVHDYVVVPSVVFTVPPLASVGFQERAARERGLRFTTHHERTASWYSSRRIGEQASGFKVLVEEDSGRVIGAHLLGPDAEEVINLFAMAMRGGVTAQTIKEMLFAYPTVASDLPYMV